VDALVTQPIYVAVVYLWRWLTSEEEDGSVVHEYHPIDGAWREVGTLDAEGPNALGIGALALGDEAGDPVLPVAVVSSSSSSNGTTGAAAARPNVDEL